MRFDAFAFMTNLLSEAGNQAINRQPCDLAVRRGMGHSGLVNACCAEVWVLGR